MNVLRSVVGMVVLLALWPTATHAQNAGDGVGLSPYIIGGAIGNPAALGQEIPLSPPCSHTRHAGCLFANAHAYEQHATMEWGSISVDTRIRSQLIEGQLAAVEFTVDGLETRLPPTDVLLVIRAMRHTPVIPAGTAARGIVASGDFSEQDVLQGRSRVLVVVQTPATTIAVAVESGREVSLMYHLRSIEP